MKRVYAYVLIFATLLCFTSCSAENINCEHCGKSIPNTARFCEHCGGLNIIDDEDAPNATPETQFSTSESITGENLLSFLKGHWACPYEYFCEGVTFDQNEVTLWTYPGEYQPTGTITNVHQDDGNFEITVYYPESEYMGSYYPEKEVQYYISSSDNYKSRISFNQLELVLIGNPTDSIADKCDELLAKENESQTDSLPNVPLSIPYVPLSSQMLNRNWETFKIQLGNDLGGTGFNNIASSALFLQNIDSLDCYNISTTSTPELLGVSNEKIAFYGSYGTSSFYVRDFVPDVALTVEPATYSVMDGKVTAYIWELNNGFLTVYGMTINAYKWYDQPAFGYVYVRDIDYLSFVN